MTASVRHKITSPASLWITAALSLLIASSHAHASVSVAASLDELLRDSTSVALVTPLAARAEWQGRRIVTYHRLRVDSSVSGDAPPGEVIVETLGGQVGKIAQRVEGEPDFSRGEPALVFLRAGREGALFVTKRGQGQFRLRAAAGRFTLLRNAELGKLLPARRGVAPRAEAAVLELHGVALETAIARIGQRWGQIHAR